MGWRHMPLMIPAHLEWVASVLVAPETVLCQNTSRENEALRTRATLWLVAHRTSMANEQTAVFGGGCFWCIEAVFNRLEGVKIAESGYMGGHVDNPTYRQVCGGDTGHVEVVRVIYDPAQVSFSDLLDVFFTVHDPTTSESAGKRRRRTVPLRNLLHVR